MRNVVRVVVVVVWRKKEEEEEEKEKAIERIRMEGEKKARLEAEGVCVGEIREQRRSFECVFLLFLFSK